MQLSTFYFWRECACSTQQAFCARARRPIAVASRPIAVASRPITVASRSNTVASRSNTVASRSNTVASPAQLCRPGYTIDDLYSNSSSPPSAARAGLLTRWFCGHDRACAKAGGPQPRAAVEATLRRAVHTLEHRYAWVGVLEQLEDSLRLLVHLLPAYFGQLAVERAAREHARPRSTSSRYTYAQPSEATRRLIEAESETDMRLYAHAVGLLHARLRRCGLRPATPRLDLVASGARS